MSTERHCIYCGSELVRSDEPGSLFDSKTGARIPEVWFNCPNYPRSVIRYLLPWFFGLKGGPHESVSDDGITGRGWR